MKIFIFMQIIYNLSTPKFENPLIYAGLSGFFPGAGNYLAGDKEVAKIFFFTEGTLILSCFLTERVIQNLVSDYRVFASLYAGADPNIKSEDYWIKVEDYFSYEDYIEYLRREARIIYPDDFEAQKDYVERHRIKHKWKWSSEREWLKFMDLRARERELDQRKRIAIFGIILNHATSFIETFFLSKSRIKKWKMGFKTDLDKNRIFMEYNF